MSEFQAIERTSGAAVVIELTGRLDGSATSRLDQLHEVFDRHPQAVVLDFGRVDYINSTGIALVVGLAARARGAGVPLRACGLTDHYAHIFRITRIADFIGMYPDQATALGTPAGDALPAG